jgi:Type II secretion system (T2SS), protein E, N-terminal domain
MTEVLWKTGKFVQDACRNWNQMLPRCAYLGCPGRRSMVNGFLRRGEGFHCNRQAWYCSPECLELALAESFRQIAAEYADSTDSSKARLPIGQVFVLKGVVSEPGLRLGLKKQAEDGGLLGECMVALGLVNEDVVTASLAAQWSCPIFPKRSIQSGCATMVPLPLEKEYDLFPVHLATGSRTLYVAHSKTIDHSVLYAIEQMLGFRTEPCILPTGQLRSLIEKREESTDSHEVFLDTPMSAYEMARTVRSYAQQTRSGSLQFKRCGKFIWVLIDRSRDAVPLIFRCDSRRAPRGT